MIHVPINFEQVDSTLPTVAIDLSGAYTLGKRGTGFACTGWCDTSAWSQDVTQTSAVHETLTFFKTVANEGAIKVNLILEAPLSWAFDSTNHGTRLDGRCREIEKSLSYQGLETPLVGDRPWIVNAGASTSLVALLFLKDLASHLPLPLKVNLFEGFWSWMAKPRKHGDVAKELLEGLKIGSNRMAALPTTSLKYQTALQLLSIPAENQQHPPLVVFGHQALADAYHRSPHHFSR